MTDKHSVRRGKSVLSKNKKRKLLLKIEEGERGKWLLTAKSDEETYIILVEMATRLGRKMGIMQSPWPELPCGPLDSRG